MATGKLDLWIDRKESLLGLERDQLTWRLHGKLKDRVPVKYVNTVTILGQTQLDSRLLCRLAECGVSVYLLNNARNSAGTAIGQTFAGPPRQRLLQYQCTSDKSQGLSVARVIVYGKLSAYWHAGVNRFSFSESWGDSIKTLMTQIDAAQTLPQLLGIEGAASRSWFEQLKQRIPEDWKFEGRNKNPPKDPVNALLSLTYTLVSQPLRQALMAWGYDLSLGFLHQVYPGRESLVCDLQEWLRPLVDCWIAEVVLAQFVPKDFALDPEYGCRLHKEKRTVFYQLWYDQYDHWPGLSDFGKARVSLPELCCQLVQALHNLFQQFVDQQEPEWRETVERIAASLLFPAIADEVDDAFDDDDDDGAANWGESES